MGEDEFCEVTRDQVCALVDWVVQLSKELENYQEKREVNWISIRNSYEQIKTRSQHLGGKIADHFEQFSSLMSPFLQNPDQNRAVQIQQALGRLKNDLRLL